MARVIERIVVEKQILNEWSRDPKRPEVERYRGCMYGHFSMRTQSIGWPSEWFTGKGAKEKAEAWANSWLNSDKLFKRNPFKIRAKEIQYVQLREDV